MKSQINPKTGLKERNVDIESILKMVNVRNFGHPKGVDIFTRMY